MIYYFFMNIFDFDRKEAKKMFTEVLKPFKDSYKIEETLDAPHEYGFRVSFDDKLKDKILKQAFSCKEIVIIEPEIQGTVTQKELQEKSKQAKPIKKDLSRFMK